MSEKFKTKKKTNNKTKSTTLKNTKTTDISSIANVGEIVFQGVKTHNLKNIDITLPKNKIITITGVSGSGKSSFAFDTVYKEGQFRYIESLSSYLRQFFNLGERPDIEFCSGLSPAVAIEQNKGVGNARSTVGTLTEIDDYLRLLFAKLGDSYCYGCGEEIKPHGIDDIMRRIKKDYMDEKVFLLQEIGEFKEASVLAKFVRKNRNKIERGKGFTRYLLVPQDKKKAEPIEYFYLEDPNIPDHYFPLNAYGIYDRVTVSKENIPRLKEDIIKILSQAPKFGIWAEFASSVRSNPEHKQILRFSDKMYCANCNIAYPDMIPQNFSPNRQEGACDHCHGIGEVLQADFDKLLDVESPLEKAILPRRDSAYGQAVVKKIAAKYDIDPTRKWKELPEWFQHVIIEGDDELLRVNMGGKYVSLRYEGVEAILKEQYIKGILTVDYQAMLDMQPCPVCHGAKIRKESLYVFLTLDKKKIAKTSPWHKFQGFIETTVKSDKRHFAEPIADKKLKFNLTDLQHMTLEDLASFIKLFQKYSLKDKLLIERITNPLLDRASTIEELGLGYMTLYRQIGTLSGGEVQRIRLAKQLGNKLTGIIYVLDEPTIGLSKREILKSIKSIRKLQEMGNTVIIVEHNEEVIKASDRVVEIGPHAGEFGGEVMFNGPYKNFLKSGTLTAQYITGKKKVNVNFEHTPSNQFLRVKKASKYNLKNIDVDIRLGSFTVITGPSGAGKTTLMYSTIYRFLKEKEKFIQSYIRLELLKKGRDRDKILMAPVINKDEYANYKMIATQEFYKDLGVDTIMGYEEIKNLIYVDQSSIGKTPRSCPATFIGVFDRIRNLYAGTKQAKYLGFANGHFSFNSAKGACPGCKGYGYKKVELQFLPDTYIPCDMCKGKRYKSEILDIQRHGKNISEILSMYIDEAKEFFDDIGHIHEELDLMVDIGLGYLKMGQPAHTLSGGESQRIKLVKHLLKSYKGHTAYFLDEPTVGLHFADIEKLLHVLKKFLNNGDTILMIEHDQNILNFADEVVRLEDGGVVKS